MGSPLATVLLTWTAVYAYVGVYYCMLYWRRPSEREYLAFGLMVLALGVWTLGHAFEVSAVDASDAVFGMRLRYFGGFAGAAYFTDFGVRISGHRAARVTVGTYVICLAGVLADVAGLLIERGPSGGGSTAAFGFFAAGTDASPTPLGAAISFASLGGPAVALVMIARGVARHRDLRAFLVAAGFGTLAAAYDTAAYATALPDLGLVSHASLLPVITMSHILLRRFESSGDELAKRTDELRLSYGELRLVQEELVRKEQLAAVGELSAVIAHEVRNPLAIIKNAVSSLRRPSLADTDRTVLLSILDEEVDRLNRLVRDLLAYARPVAPRGAPIDLGALIGEVLTALLERRGAGEAVELRLEGDALADVQGDPDLLRQAFENVTDNAIQAMPDGGVFEVEATREDARTVRITFRDNGVGMGKDELKKALDPFFTTRATGTGLGLAIVDRVIRNHGGEVSLTSEAGDGTVVIVRLPCPTGPR